MPHIPDVEIVLVSSGHSALDHRVFHKEAVSLARYFPRVRVVATHPNPDEKERVTITGLPASTNRLERFALRPLRCLLAARGPGKRLLILHDAELLWLVPWIKLFTRWKIIYDVHEDFAQLLLRRNWIPVSLRRSISRGVGTVEKACSAWCDGIIGVTAVLTEQFGHRRRTAIYNLPGHAFIAMAEQHARPLGERTYDLVHLGTLSEERVEFLCAVLQALFARKPDARVLIIGARGSQPALLRARFPQERVTVREQIPYHQVTPLLGECRIGLNIHPVLYPHLRCAVPVKVFEYMAAGCNVITSFLPELHRLLDAEGTDHVVTIYTADAERFAEDIVRLLASPEILEGHQLALMRLVKTRWNWECEEAKLVQFVTSIIERKEIVADEQIPHR